MKQRHISVIIALLLCLPLGAQQAYQARVVDAETGKALPHVSVCLSASRGTLCNRDGEFSISAEADEELTFSYVGYEKKTMRASTVSDIVRLTPSEQSPNEPIVHPLSADKIVKRISKKLYKESIRQGSVRKKKNTNSMVVYELQPIPDVTGRNYILAPPKPKIIEPKKTLYFFRTFTKREDGANEMLEGFCNASSSINIKKISVIGGQSRIDGIPGTRALSNTNFQKIFSLGPVVYGEKFWNQALQPLSDNEDIQKAYDKDIYLIQNEDGRRIYKIVCRYNGQTPKEWQGRVFIQGTLFADAKTYNLLHFDGEVLGMRQVFDGLPMPMKLSFHTDYSHERKITEVTHISFDGGTDAVNYHCLLFKVDKAASGDEQQTTQNLVRDTRSSGCNAMLWEKYDIVKRTKEEEQTIIR